ncbi:hypothetical protein ACMFMG_010139 [Clarireedia jacksonii]
MSPTQAQMNHQAQHASDIQNPHRAQNPLPQSTSPLDVTGPPNFDDYSFPYGLGEGVVPQEVKLESSADPFNLSAPPEHRTSIVSIPTMNRNVFGSIGSGQARHTSVSGASDEASPTSNRTGGVGGIDSNYSDDFGLNKGSAGDGSDLGSRTRDEKNEPAPPWSELKTKAGKERKRLPLACIACRRKKIRCSGEKPACKHCLRSRIPCVYKVTTRKAAPRTDYMAMLDKRLKRMEERIIKIIPKGEQENIPAITRANVKPAIPGTVPNKSTAGKKRAADEAFGSELENWSKTIAKPPTSSEQNSKPTSLMIQEAEEGKLLTEGAEKVPPKDIQEHLAEVFFENVYGQTYHVLHKPSFMRKLKAGTVPPVLILAVCACAARFSQHPHLNSEPAFLRGEEWATEAREIVVRRYEWPNITILTCLLILGLHEFGTCQGGRSWALGGQAIRMAYALQLHKDLDYDPQKRNGTAELSFIDREIRRRTMWACFLMDRFNSSGTDRPTFIKEKTIKIQLPVKESMFQMDIPGPTENIRGEVPHPVKPGGGQLANPKQNMGVAAYMIRSIAIWGSIISYLNQGGSDLDPHPMWHPESQYTNLLKQMEDFSKSLPDDMAYTQENLHTHDTEGLANQFLFLHVTVQQNILFMNRFAVPMEPGGRPSKDAPKEFVTKAGAKAIEAANRIAELIYDGESYFITAPFTGYCAFLASTVLIFGAFSKSPALEATAKKNLAITVKYLTKMKKYWGMFHWMSENLKEQYRRCADIANQDPSARKSSNTSNPSIFQYGDWFDRYPHGVSQSDFEDPAVTIKKEKGDDAVLEQKSSYSTVEDFFHSLESLHPHEREPPHTKRKTKKTQASSRPEQIQTNMQPPAAMQLQTNPSSSTHPQLSPHQPQQQQQQQHPQPHQPNPYIPQISPTTPLYPHQSLYPNHHDLLMPPQGMLPQQLDRQLVFNAYGGMDPGGGAGGGMNAMDGWDFGVGGADAMHGFDGPSSAWFMPFNMEPPEIGGDGDVLGGGYALGMGMGGPGGNAGAGMGGAGRG